MASVRILTIILESGVLRGMSEVLLCNFVGSVGFYPAGSDDGLKDQSIFGNDSEVALGSCRG